MTRLTKGITIDATVDDVFDFLKNPANLMGAVPGNDVRDVNQTPEGLGTTAAWEGKFFGFPAAGNVEYTEFVPNQRLVLSSSRGFVFSFTVEPTVTRTRLILAEEDVPSNWFEAAVDAVAMRLTEHDLDIWLANLQAAVEAKAG